MSVTTTTRRATLDEIVNEMDRRGDVILALEAEIRRLRGELSSIADAFTAHGYSDAIDAVQLMKDMARSALKEGGE